MANIWFFVAMYYIRGCATLSFLMNEEETFRDLLQSGEHLGQLLLSLGQLSTSGEVHPEQSHDGVNDLKRHRGTRDSLLPSHNNTFKTYLNPHCRR